MDRAVITPLEADGFLKKKLRDRLSQEQWQRLFEIINDRIATCWDGVAVPLPVHSLRNVVGDRFSDTWTHVIEPVLVAAGWFVQTLRDTKDPACIWTVILFKPDPGTQDAPR